MEPFAKYNDLFFEQKADHWNNYVAFAYFRNEECSIIYDVIYLQSSLN